MIEQVLFTVLSTTTGIHSLCGTRVYPVTLPEKVTLPAIDYSFIGGSSSGTQDTFGNQRYRVEINCWGDTYGDAATLRHAVISGLDQYRGDNIFIVFIHRVDFFDYDAFSYRATAEFYIYSNFTP